MKQSKILAICLLSMMVVTCMIAFARADAYQEQNTPSNVTVNVFVEISLSTGLSNGILFGAVLPDTTNNLATLNLNASNMTNYWVTAGAANSVDVDLCIKDDVALTQSALTIPNTNYLYAFDTTNDIDAPAVGDADAITTGYVATQDAGIAPEGVSYARFWLSVPAATPAGTYANVVYVKGIQTGQSC